MLVVAGRIAVKPERRDEALRLAAEVVAATRAEPGCISYRFYRDLDDPDGFFIFEEWESAEALGAHFATPHMARFAARIPELVAAPPTITRYDVATSAPL